MQTWLSLIPPVITLIVAYYSRSITYSLLLGIVSGCFIITSFSPIATVSLTLSSIWNTTQLGNIITHTGQYNRLYMFIFLIALGIIITLIRKTGGINAYGNLVTNYLKTGQQVELATILLSSLLFMDDYLSNLTTGSVMQPVTDRFRIPRIKLAFLVNSMAAPITILSPISSWVAEITTQLSSAGVNTVALPTTLIIASPFYAYVHLVPSILYSFILVSSVLFIICTRISFGTMAAQEQTALATGNVWGGKQPLTDHAKESHQGSIIDFALPLLVLIIATVVGLAYTGNYSGFGGTESLVKAFQKGDIFSSLLYAGVLSLSTGLLLGLVRQKIFFSDLPILCFDGFNLMYSSIIMLCLAWTLSSLITNELGTGYYLAHILQGSIPLVLLPCIFFIIAALTTIAVGSAWGAIAIMTAIAVPMIVSLSTASVPALLSELPLFFPVLGAILSGAIAGNTLSPIGDATIMASTSTNSYHEDHVRTQFAYSVAPLCGTIIAFLVYGALTFYIPLSFAIFIALSIGIGISFSMLSYQNHNEQHKKKRNSLNAQ